MEESVPFDIQQISPHIYHILLNSSSLGTYQAFIKAQQGRSQIFKAISLKVSESEKNNSTIDEDYNKAIKVSQSSNKNDNSSYLESLNENNSTLSLNPSCSGKITSISQQGLVTLEFSDDVEVTGDFNNQTVSINVVPSNPMYLEDISLYWKVQSITSQGIEI